MSSTAHPDSPLATETVALPPLTDEAREEFFRLIRTYCVDLPKGQDSDDFHLETVRFSSAIDVRFLSRIFLVCIIYIQRQVWCSKNQRSFENLEHDLLNNPELGDAFNIARSVFRRIGYMQVLIPDAIWEDREHRPKIVHLLIKGIMTPKARERNAAYTLAQRMAETPSSFVESFSYQV